MPRLGRVVLQNYPYHVVQRGHKKQAVFAEEAGYRYYLKTIEGFNLETAVGRGAECVIFFAWQGESGPLIR
jgi:hypothetical protein